MTTIDNKSINITISDSQKSSIHQAFCVICDENIPDFDKKLTLLILPFLESDTVEMAQLFEEGVTIGLHSIINEPKTSERFPFFTDLAYFFLYYFVLVYQSSTDKSKKIMVGNLKNGLNNHMGFPSFFFELAVAHTFKSKGHIVEFLEPSQEPNVSTPDLLVKSDLDDLYIECKCVTANRRTNLPDGLLKPLSNLLSIAFEKFATGKFEFLLEVKYKGKRECFLDKTLHRLTYLLPNLQKLDQIVENELWSVTLKKLSYELSEPHTQEKLHPPYTHPSLVGGAVLGIPKVGYIVIRSNLEWELDVAVAKTIKQAISQLPTKGLRIIFLQLLGSHSFTHFMKTSLLEIVLYNKDSKRRLRSEMEKNDGFIGLQIAEDFVTLDKGSGIKLLDYASSLFGTTDIKTHDFYMTHYLGFTPADYARSTKQVDI